MVKPMVKVRDGGKRFLEAVKLKLKNMSADLQQRIPHLVNTRKAAEILGRSPATLKRWRYEGVGPAYVEIERIFDSRLQFHALIFRRGICQIGVV
jgi:hypothetical protein